MTRQCIYGAPDFVLEIISPSTKRKDSIKKLAKYENAGVREYWILDPYEKRILVYFFENEICPAIYASINQCQ
jgi:Uma2 family endonuclease